MSGQTQTDSNEAAENAFKRFLSGSEIYGLPLEGSYGKLYRYVLTEPENKKYDVYRSSDADTYGNIVKMILVKFVYLRDPDDIKKDKDSHGIRYIKEENFISESDIQKHIYDETKEDLEPLCPAVLYSGTFFADDEMIRDALQMPGIMVTHGPKQKLGIIAMEFMNSYQNMNDLLYDLRKQKILNKYGKAVFMAAAFLLIELAHKTGYTQGDFHFENIFFKTIPTNSERPYFLTDGIQSIEYINRFKPLIIDFGRAKPIQSVDTSYKNYKFREILGIICAEGCNEEQNLILKRPYNYGWASGSQNVIISENDLKEYENNVKNNPDALCFLKNAVLRDDEGNVIDSFNLNKHNLHFLNSNFDGENGLMNSLVMARDNSRMRINIFKGELERIKLSVNINTSDLTNQNDSNDDSNDENVPQLVAETKIEEEKGISENINKPEHLPYDVRSTIATPKKGLFSRLSRSVSKAASRVGRALYAASAGKTRKKNKRRTKRRKNKRK